MEAEIVGLKIVDYKIALDLLIDELTEKVDRVREIVILGADSNDVREEAKLLFSNIRYLCIRGRVFLFKMSDKSMSDSFSRKLQFQGSIIDGISIDSNGLERIFFDRYVNSSDYI